MAIWHLFSSLVSQIRVTQGAILGLDMPACLEITDAAGVDRRVAAFLLPELSAGLVAGFKKKSNHEDV